MLAAAGQDAPHCAHCSYAATLRAGGACDPHDACVMAHSGRRIDRFLKRHPQHAERFLQDEFWERRAIAARYAPLAAITALVNDADEAVRRVVASRLAPEDAAALMRDPDREVRITVAQRIDADQLLTMSGDPGSPRPPTRNRSPMRARADRTARSGVVDATPIELALASALRRRGGHAHIITFSDISWDMSRFDFVIEAYRFTDISSREGDNSYTEVAKFFILDGAGKELNEGTVREVFTGANRPNVVERLAESIARQLEPRRHDGVFTVRIAPERRFAPPRSFTAA